MRKYTTYRLIAYILFTFLIIVGLCPFTVKAATGDASFWIEYIDVGQGDAALIQCDGQYMMIDGGPSDASQTIYSVLKNKNIQNIDYMIATHPDADHIGGLSGALNFANVNVCFSSTTEHDSKTFSSLVKYLEKQGVSIKVPYSGEKFYLGNATVTIIKPIYKDADTNNNSLIVKLVYGKNTFIFMGDAEEEEESFLASEWDLKSDVIKIGHHGSSSSSSNRLLKTVNPQYAIISVGKDNAYGHPTEDTLNRLSSIGITVYRTDLQGDIVLTSDGKKINITTEKNAQAEVYTNANNTRAIPTYDEEETSYVLNINTKKFHRPTCSSVYDMKAKNRKDVSLPREEIINQGYVGCKRCIP